jgi:hypothetical protein
MNSNRSPWRWHCRKNAGFRIAAVAAVVLLLSGTPASARKKAADPDSYLDCLQQGMAAAPAGDPSAVRLKVLADCFLIRRGVATVTMALLTFNGEGTKRAAAETDQMMAADDEKALGISHQDDAALFAAYRTLEKTLATAKADYRIHPDGQVDCVLTQSSGDADVDAVRCKSPQGCPPLDAKPGANNNAALICVDTERRKQLLLLAIERAGLVSLYAKDKANTPSQ